MTDPHRTTPLTARTAAALALVLGGALAIRLAVFSGAVLPDDMVYVSLVQQIREGGWPAFDELNPWSGRPLLLMVLRASLAVFGWNDGGLVAPFLFASLALVAIVYAVAARYWGRGAGIAAAAAFALFPLDAVHASTLTNDILVSLLVWGGVALAALTGFERKRRAALVFAIAGLLVGSAAAVKLSGAGLGVVAIAFVALAAGRRRAGIAAAFAAGWLVAQIALCAWVASKTGDGLAHVRVERAYYLGSEWLTHNAGVGAELARYPLWMAGVEFERLQGMALRPYGFFFWGLVLALPWALISPGAPRRLAFGTLAVFAVMEFAPLRLWHYLPIHRLPRALHVLGPPTACLYGWALAAAWRRGSRQRTAAVAIAVTLAIACALTVTRNGGFSRDSGRDRSWAWSVVRDANPARIATDVEMAQYFQFRAMMTPPFALDIVETPPPNPAPRDVWVYGGSRRPDYRVENAEAWVEAAKSAGCAPLAVSPFPLRPWRTSPTAVCRVR